MSHLALASALIIGAAGSARAQDASAAAQTTRGPMTVERITSGFLAAPDVKVTDVDHHTSALAGGYAGWLSEQTFFIGGGGYWLANNHNDQHMGYGGLVAGLLGRTDKTIGFGAKALIGGGSATLGTTVQQLVFPPVVTPPIATPPGQRPQPGPAPAPVVRSVDVRLHDDFFVFEPEANVLVNFTRHVRLSGGVGYRVVGADRDFSHRLRGATASVALQISGS
jgi:hypothetical protein